MVMSDTARPRAQSSRRPVLLAALALLALGARPLADAAPSAFRQLHGPSPAPLLRVETPLPEACKAAGVTYPPRPGRLEVFKARRLMRLFSGETLVKEYPVALGLAPVGDKERQGDYRTPEGEFYLCTRNGTSRFHRFIGISYPAVDDARRGLKERLITRAQRAAIARAAGRRAQPPWDTKLGGAVGIHGGGTGSDWTWGCVALSNEHVAELFTALRLGTPVVIYP